MRRLALLLAAIVLSGCATKTLVTDSSCNTFKQISHSRKDTEQTRREVIGHNKAFDAVCPAKS